MFILLQLGMFYSSWARGMAQPLHTSQATALVTVGRDLGSNATIPCVFNGVEYFVSWMSLNLITCESIIHDTTVAVAKSANNRSVTGILWSCLATVFACTWVSVHPNIPHPDASEWQIHRYRFLMMLCGLVAPELIVLWALRQWIGAHVLVKKMKKKNIEGFTAVHGHFLQMGGFMQYSNGAPVGVIQDYHQLLSCITNWNFILPTAEEIQDRSKGDGLSKALVVGQTGWFATQCLSRWGAGLAITEMELVTVAFAMLNGIVYSLWWSKPLNVRYAVRVVRPSGDSEPDPNELSHQDSFTTATSSSEVTRDSNGRISIDDLHSIRSMLVTSRIGRLLEQYLGQGDGGRTDKHLTISILHSNCDSQDTFGATAVASTVGILFGAVHCIAWNFHFLSQHERTLWRVWSTITTIIPTLLFVRSSTGYLYIKHHSEGAASYSLGSTTLGRKLLWITITINRFSVWATILAVPVYVAARIGLLVQAFVALRDLQPAERAQLRWVDFLPHL